MNWARTNLGEKEKQLSYQHDSDHLRALQYSGRVIILRKHIIFVRENKLKSDSNFILAGSKMLCISVLMFLKVSRHFFPLDTFGRQADEYIAPRVMFFMFFMYLCLPI